ncbi:hypothetical protein [Pedobacter gandavensis]|uniref:Uncharacterized protein n=1 Tax=Pedobacter gandavensis TaxID=2679963 RepID=A0ABR6F278_9SPHI|nr:hypothetical protein [Pedobacter gandavensis]MBB2151638.1 hypothetical protein [Pedobacter gandavensis]
MSLLNYFKEITIGWKLSLFIVAFCVWPVSAYLIFHFDTQLFRDLDLAKLTLLSSAIASPFLVINTGASFLLTNPKDDDLKWGNSADELLSGTVLIGVGVTLWVLSFGALAALIGCSFLAVKLIMLGIEVCFLIIIIWSKIIEDRRFNAKSTTGNQ